MPNALEAFVMLFKLILVLSVSMLIQACGGSSSSAAASENAKTTSTFGSVKFGGSVLSK